MIVGIDCIAHDPTYRGGVNAYAIGLLHAFAKKAHASCSFRVFVTAKSKPLFADLPQTQNFQLIEVPKAQLFWRTLRKLSIYIQSPKIFEFSSNKMWKVASEIIAKNCDVLYVPGTVLQFFSHDIPTVLSMHDIQQTHYPQFFNRFELKFRTIAYDLSARKISLLQASSQFIGEDFLKSFNFLTRKQVCLVREGVQLDVFQAPPPYSSAEICEKYNLPAEFIYKPAQLWPHKDHKTVLKALFEVKRDSGMEIPLVLTGARYGSTSKVLDLVTELNLQSQVYYLGTVSFKDLISLYHASKFVLTASVYESSSLPILEAAASRSAIIAADTAPNQELGETLEINYFRTSDSVSLSRLLRSIWKDAEKIEAQAKFNSKSVEKFSWDNAAAMYIQQFSKLQVR